MAKEKSKKSYASKQNTAAIIAIVLICVYVISQVVEVMNVKLETETATVSTVYETLDVEALVIRDEAVIYNDDSDVIVSSLSSGDKVQVGGQIAMQFSSEENAQKYSKYLSLQSELEYYTGLESQTVGLATDVETLDENILADINSYIRAIASGDGDDITEYEESLNDKFTKRQILIGDDVSFTSAIAEINDEIGELDITGADPTGYITTDESGIYSTYVDGFESVFDYSAVDELDVDTLTAYISTVQNGEGDSTENAIGKIITSFDWYFCAVVSSDEIDGLDTGDSIDVTLKDSNEVLSCEIVQGDDGDSLNSSDRVLILECNDITSDITSLRYEEIQIRTNEYTGIKVSSEAVHVVDGEKGVYALVSSIVKWREAEVLYTADNYVILSYDEDDSSGIKLYDEIIIQGKELYDGKVYT